jgi:hypothetical protein
MLHTARTLGLITAWGFTALACVYTLAGPGGMVFDNPLAAAGAALIGLGMLKQSGLLTPETATQHTN